MDVGGVLSPGEEGALRSLKLVPSLVSSEGVGVEFREKSWSDDLTDNLSNFVSGGPDISEHDGVSILVSANWVDLEVNVDSASEGIGDNKRW